MLNRIIISIGLSLITGVVARYNSAEKKYFVYERREPKREITEVKYKDAVDKDRYYSNYGNEYHYDSKDCTIETTYDNSKAIMIGIFTLGGLLAYSGDVDHLIPVYIDQSF